MHTTDRSDESHDAHAGRVAGVVSAGVMLVAFGGLALGFDHYWIAFPVGYGAVLPLAVSYAKAAGEPQQPPTDRLDRLKQRYVEGEIDEATFEREVDAHLGASGRE